MRIVIFANGVMDDPATDAEAWVRSDDMVVAADGGTHHALAAGLTPHRVIGDLDSLPDDLRRDLEVKGTEFDVHPAAKDETDLELALLWAADHILARATEHVLLLAEAPADEEIVVLGAFGGRPDQALANLLLLALPALRDTNVSYVDGPWIVRLIPSGVDMTLRGQAGDRLSLIPLAGPAEGVSATGLEYPLRDETLAFGPARGVSNRFAAPEVVVRVQQGLLWCFHERTF